MSYSPHRTLALLTSLCCAPFAGTAQSTTPVAPSSPTSRPAAQLPTVYLPTPNPDGSTQELTNALKTRRPVACSFFRQRLGDALARLTTACGQPVTASQTARDIEITAEIRGDLTPLEVLHQACLAAACHATIESNGTIRILTPKECTTLAKKPGVLGAPAAVPAYYPQLEIRMVAVPEASPKGIDLKTERKRLENWLAAPKNRDALLRETATLARFHRLSAASGGRASAHIRWYPYFFSGPPKGKVSLSAFPQTREAVVSVGVTPRRPGKQRQPQAQRLELVAVDLRPQGFTTLDLRADALARRIDPTGSPVLEFRMHPEASRAYRTLTGKSIRKAMALVLDGRVLSTPVIMGAIPGIGQISGLQKTQIDQIIEGIQGAKKPSFLRRLLNGGPRAKPPTKKR